MKYKSEICQIVHEDMVGNFEIGAITKKAMQEFDEMCLAPEVPQLQTQHSTPKVKYAAASSV